MSYIIHNQNEIIIDFDSNSKFNSLLRSMGEKEYAGYSYPRLNQEFLPEANFSIAPNGKYKFYKSVIKSYRSKECMEKCTTDKCSTSNYYHHRKTSFDLENDDINNYTIDYLYKREINNKYDSVDRPLKIKL